MKKDLNDLLDGASPEELDAFRDDLTAPAPPPGVLVSIRKKTYAKAGIGGRRSSRRLWLVLGSAAACALLIVGMVTAAMIFKRADEPVTPAPPVDESETDAGSQAQEHDESEGTTEAETLDPNAPYLDPVLSAERTSGGVSVCCVSGNLGTEEKKIISGAVDSAEELGVGMMTEGTVREDGKEITYRLYSTGKISTFPYFGNIEFKYGSSHYKPSKKGSHDVGQYYSTYDNYNYNSDEGTQITVDVMHDTGRIVWFTIHDSYTKQHGEKFGLCADNFTQEEANEIGSRFLKDFLGGDEYLKYDPMNNMYVEATGLCVVRFRRMVCGVGTEDAIVLRLDHSGRVVWFSGEMIGAFEPFTEVITEETLDAARAAIREKAASIPAFEGMEPTVSFGNLLVSTDGIVYQNAYAWVEKEDVVIEFRLLAPVPGAALIFPDDE